MPWDASIEVQGEEVVQRKVAVVLGLPGLSHDEIGDHARKDAEHFRGKAYPARRPKQQYVRTYQLKSNITTRSVQRGVWQIDSFSSYAVWVIKKGMQNRDYHLERWWTVDDEVEVRAPMLADKVATEIETRWRQA
jgi:hypothetical protein